ncbi:MAG: cell wall hydrolase [Lachnospiraceae bacterium]|nr:cell wall hydrolase [Lachnospiraceae bacterium]
MKKLMHTGTAVILGIALIAGVLGSMHMVYAAKTAKHTKEGIKTAVSIANSKINKTMPTVELNVETETVEPKIVVSASQGENEDGDGGAVAGISYDRLAMANVMEAVNIREEPSEDSSIIGKLYKECGGEILERLDGWTKLKTGSVTGYVSNDYLLFGDEAKELARTAVDMIATSNTSCLRVRTEPNEEATVLGLLAVGDKITAVEKLGDWIKAEYSDGTECYVASRYVDISEELPYGESMDVIRKREEETKAFEEAASREMASAEKSEKTEKDSSEAPAKSPAPGLDPSNIDDVRLLAALIQCEGGNEVHEGQVAIGDVVMNRLRTGRYGSSIYSVIYAKAQFGPAGSGKVAQVYASGPSASCLQAAAEAMSGVSYIGNATSFRNVNSGHLGIVVGNHVFW